MEFWTAPEREQLELNMQSLRQRAGQIQRESSARRPTSAPGIATQPTLVPGRGHILGAKNKSPPTKWSDR